MACAQLVQRAHRAPITLDHNKKLKNNTFVRNTRHFDNEFDFACTEGFEGTEVDHIMPQ